MWTKEIDVTISRVESIKMIPCVTFAATMLIASVVTGTILGTILAGNLCTQKFPLCQMLMRLQNFTSIERIHPRTSRDVILSLLV